MSAVLEFFDLLSSHLLSQNKKSCTKGGRPLTYSKDNTDPLGKVILKRKWKKEFDKQGAYGEDVQAILDLDPERLEVLLEMQAIHDVIIPEKWDEWIQLLRPAHSEDALPITEDLEEIDDDLDITEDMDELLEREECDV